jgi:hypothetical protein
MEFLCKKKVEVRQFVGLGDGGIFGVPIFSVLSYFLAPEQAGALRFDD